MKMTPQCHGFVERNDKDDEASDDDKAVMKATMKAMPMTRTHGGVAPAPHRPMRSPTDSAVCNS